MKHSLVLTILCMCVMIVNAQPHYIVEAGYVLSANYSPSLVLQHPLNGAQIEASVNHQFKFFPLLGFKIGLGYRFEGYYSSKRSLSRPNYQYTKGDYEYLVDQSVFLPVRFTMNFDVSDWNIRVLTGPSLSYHWWKEEKYTAAASPKKISGNLGEVYLPWDCSWGIGVGCSYKHLYLELDYDTGLFDRTRNSHVASVMNTFISRNFSLMAGYEF